MRRRKARDIKQYKEENRKEGVTEETRKISIKRQEVGSKEKRETVKKAKTAKSEKTIEGGAKQERGEEITRKKEGKERRRE